MLSERALVRMKRALGLAEHPGADSNRRPRA